MNDDDIDAIPESGEGVTEKEFKKANARINYLRFSKKLDENQLAALKPMKGKHFKTLTEAQRQQIVTMAKGK